jgi:hypothetical protein
MSTLIFDHLRDPAPPVPGPAVRAAVAVRARQLTHRRRVTQIGAALAIVAVLGVGAVGISSAISRSDNSVTTPAVKVDIFGSFVEFPDGTTGTVTLAAIDDPLTPLYTATVAKDGTFFFSGVKDGQYLVAWSWETPDQTAAQVGRLPNPITFSDGHEVKLMNLKA